MVKQIIILGTGGNCVDILDTILDINDKAGKEIYRCIGFLDDNTANHGQSFYGVPVLGSLESAPQYLDAHFVNGIGSSLNFWKKEAIIAKTQIPHERFETIIHPSAVVSRMVKLGHGVVVFQNVVITSNVQIGNHVIILPNTVISHDDIIGDYTCITGGVCVSGGVVIGKSCYLGTNSTIIGNVHIGDRALVGMGSTVLQNVPANTVVVGNPAKPIRPTLVDL